MKIFVYIIKIAVNYPILLPFAYHLQNCAELGFFFFFEIGNTSFKKKNKIPSQRQRRRPVNRGLIPILPGIACKQR